MQCKWGDAKSIPTEVLLSPYADWEREMRAEHVKDIWEVTIPGLPGRDGGPATLPITYEIEVPLLLPVYIRVDGPEISGNARKILDNQSWFLVLPKDSLKGLSDLANLGATAAQDSELRYQIVYLREPGRIPDVLVGAFTVLHVGPAVPGGSAGPPVLAADPRREPVRNGGPRGLSGEAPPVVTALIDAEIGIANERFRTRDGKTRVHHFWRQQRETLAGIPDMVIGRAFDAAAINTMLCLAEGDERRFYELMRRGDYGAPAFKKPTGSVETALARVLRARMPATEALDEVTITENGEKIDLAEMDDELRAFLFPPPGRPPRANRNWNYRTPPYVTDDQSRPLGLRAAHGSFVADLAAGAPMADAPADRPIVAVELPDYVVADTAGQRLEIFCLMGVRRILEWVNDWQGSGAAVPVVINISLGNTAGPRDGKGFLEAEIARLVEAREAGGGPATKVVIAAGNSYRARLSASFELGSGRDETLDWRVLPGDRSPSFLEIRVPEEVSVEIAPPGAGWHTVPVAGVQDLTCDGQKAGRVYVQAEGSARLVTVALAPTLALDRPDARAPAGRYRVRVRNAGTGRQLVKMDVQRGDTLIGWPNYGRQSYLDHPTLVGRDRETGSHDRPEAGSPLSRLRTLSAQGTSNSPQVFVIGGALAAQDLRAARYTGAGPTYGARAAPDLAAVSEDGPATPGRRAAGYLSGSTTVFRGTSSAAPQITRRIVELLAEKGDKTKDDILLAALHPAGVVTPPDPRLGHGVIAPRAEAGRKPRRRTGSV